MGPKILIGCEFSGVVRNAFRSEGFDAYSCDLEECEDGCYTRHIVGDVFDVFHDVRPDLLVVHPPCTALCVSGNRWYADSEEREEALLFIEKLLALPVKHLALENPVGVISTRIRPPDQYVQPWMFGHGETKKTGFWLRNLPLLEPTKIAKERRHRIALMSPSIRRSKERSITYTGIAEAMAKQWGNHVRNNYAG